MMNNNFNNGAANNNNNELNGGKMIMVNGRVVNLVAFGEVVKGAIEELCTDCMVSVNEITKNNGLTLTGITIKSKDSNLAPTIYLNDMYKEYLAGTSLGEIVNRVIKVYQENRVHNDFDVSAITDFDRVKSRICFKLVNAERNVALLETVPYVEFHDLAVVFYILLSCDAGGNATVTIKNEMLDIWGINDINDLYELAKHNTTRIMRATVNSMFEVVMGIVADHPDSIDKDIVDSLFDMNVYEDSVAPMFVATNKQKLQGSCVMLYDGLLATFAERIGGDFFVLPSSVHELIFVPCNGMDADNLLDMVGCVNATEVSVDEFLSNHIYRYDSVNDSLEML